MKLGNSSVLLRAHQWPGYSFAKAVVEPVAFGTPNVVANPAKLLKIMIQFTLAGCRIKKKELTGLHYFRTFIQ